MRPIIRVETLSKQYRIGTRQAPYATLRESLTNAVTAPFRRFQSTPHSALRTPRSEDTFWALKDVSFEVQPGEVVGVIGRNGAGKSTLLKLLSRITEPTSGRIDLYGRVGSLLEVGTGFHAELTGRENIYLNGAILGMKRVEINAKLDEIIAFAEIEKFIDTPVKHYSSGMYMRLAFAVAAHLDPEILIVDEVLAVGDATFQKKCLGKMKDAANHGKTVFFVSHNLPAIRQLCSKSILLSEGKKITEGITDSVLTTYLQSGTEKNSAHLLLPDASDQKCVRKVAVSLLTEGGELQTEFRLGEPWKIRLEFELLRAISEVIAAVGLVTVDSIALITYWSEPKDLVPGTYYAEFTCDVPLSAMGLRLAVGISSGNTSLYYVDGVGGASISEVACAQQPHRTKGAGLLLNTRTYEIQPVLKFTLSENSANIVDLTTKWSAVNTASAL